MMSLLKDTFARIKRTGAAGVLALATATTALTPNFSYAADGPSGPARTVSTYSTHDMPPHNYPFSLSAWSAEQSIEHDVIGISITRHANFKYPADKLARFFEGSFAKEGVDAKVFVNDIPANSQPGASGSMFYKGITYGPYHIVDLMKAIPGVSCDYYTHNPERMTAKQNLDTLECEDYKAGDPLASHD